MVLSLQTQNVLKNKQTPQGLPIFNGVSLFAGVMPYVLPDDDGVDQMVGVASLPDDLFNSDSLRSLSGVGIYLEHPTDFTDNLDNAVGIVMGGTPDSDYDPASNSTVYFVRLSLAIWDSDAINFIQAGNKELSAGYDTTFVKEEGLWYGSPYQYKKTDIVYNHLAILPSGTARNGSYSQITDSSQSSKKKNLCAQLTIVDSRYVNKSVESLTEDRRMDKFMLSDGNYIEISPESKPVLKAFVKSVLDSKNQVDESIKALDTAIAEKKALELKLTDAATATAELQNKLAEVEAEKIRELEAIKRSNRIAKKASEIGIPIDEETFDPDKVLRDALSKKGYKVDDTIPVSALEYAFSHLQPEIEVSPVTTATDSKAVKKSATAIVGKNTALKAALDQAVPVVDSADDFSSEALAQHTYNMRSQARKKATSK